ncbi:MAG: restriction endonuclease [Gammaproteobacteria bacterium]|nr:restriction endonuclease [Gammaproteobacteria bacterium]MYF01819.1 restriction endonuclease [Gammaproteobacteria bacterium]MYI76144.1 restriction endonuclease [Gammaproteobacteria bacterium]
MTETGEDFLLNPFGKTETEIDVNEGNFKLLRLIADIEPCQQKHLLPEWSNYLKNNTANKAVSVFKDTLRRRLVNTKDRELILKQEKSMYVLSDLGRSYLREHQGQFVATEHNEIRDLAKRQEAKTRKDLLYLLSNIDPYEFEHVIGQLLEAMGYQDIEVTSKSGDSGVDVVAKIELGITAVREVVQVKRHSRTIQRNVLDALRGVLHRFDAVRGSIITTSKFSKGAEEAAFERGAPPITLINGEKLLDLLVEYELGVEKQNIKFLRLDAEFFRMSP